MTLIGAIQDAMLSDDCDDSDKLIALYQTADERGKRLLDDALICLCGYALSTMIDRSGS